MMNISKNKCVGCEICESKCPLGAISLNMELGIAVIDKNKCTDCGLCVESCPQNAVKEITGEYVFAIGTDDKETIKSDDHVGMSKYFQIFKYSPKYDKLIFQETRVNPKYEEAKAKVHGDPEKAKAVSLILVGIDAIVGKMMGPNIVRLKNKFVPIIIREPRIEKAKEKIKEYINEIDEENQKTGEKRHGIILK